MKFVYWHAESGRWYWHLVARNGRVIAASQGYVSKQGALKGIAAVKATADSPIVRMGQEDE